MMSDNPMIALNPDPPSQVRRSGRTAVIVLLLSYVSAAVFFLVARLAADNLEVHDVCSTFGLAIAAVGTLWGLFLAARTTAAGGSALTVVCVLLVTGCALTYPLLRFWHSNESVSGNWTYLHYLCIPLLIPLGTFTALLALPLYVALCRFFRREGVLTPGKRRRASIVAIVAWLVLFFAGLPFAFVVYGSTVRGITSSVAKNLWTVRAAKAMPAWVADNAFEVLQMLPQRMKGELPERMASHGVLSEGYFLPLLEHEFATREGDYGVLAAFPRNYPEAAIKWTKQVLSRPAQLTMLDEELADVFIENATSDDMRALLKDEARWKGSPKGLHRHILIYLWKRRDSKQLVPDVAAISSPEPSIQHWKMNFLCIHADDETAIQAYAEYAGNRANVPYLPRIVWQLAKSQRWTVLIFALQRDNQTLCVFTLCSFLMDYSGKRVFENRTLPLALHNPLRELLSDKDQHLATLAGLVVIDSEGELTGDLQKMYCGLPQRPKSIDSDKLHATSAEQNRAVIEKARAILQR